MHKRKHTAADDVYHWNAEQIHLMWKSIYVNDIKFVAQTRDSIEMLQICTTTDHTIESAIVHWEW